LNSSNTVEFSLDDADLLKYLFLLQQALADDVKLISAFKNCIQGQAKPVKLFFNLKLEVNYAKSPFPRIYRDILSANKIDLNQRNLIRPALNYMQIGISFNYIPQYNGFEENMTTLISVLHDLRALEILRNKLPQVHNEIQSRVKGSEAGMFYLLDSIEGFNHEE
jgi:predicted O-linked N-acetylglucosamine transferase (SPINDLY family)